MRVLFLTHFFPPEIGAPQSRILETAKNLRELGHEVAVLTTFPNYPSGVIPPEYRGKTFMSEEIEGIPVLRSWLYSAPNRGFGRRILNHGSFAVTALPAASRLPWRPDVISVDMHPIFLCGTALLLKRMWGTPYVINAGDLIPDQAIAFGALTNPIAIWLTRQLSDTVCQYASMIVPLTQGIGQALAARGVQEEKLEVIYYGANTSTFARPEEWQPPPDSLSWVFDLRFVLTYAGTHGLGQGLDIVVDAADLLRDQSDVHFLLIGDGSEKQRLIAKSHELGLTNITFAEPLPRLMMPEIYRRSGACLVSLRRLDFLRLAGLPSKLFEIMAAARPVIAAAEGESVDFVQRANAGIGTPPESPTDLVHAILQLRDNPELGDRLGVNGQRFVQEHLSREQQSLRYETVLRRAVEGHAIRRLNRTNPAAPHWWRRWWERAVRR